MAELRVVLEGVRQNTAAVAGLLRERGLGLTAVTKACLGEPRVAEAMLAGGATALADSHDSSLRRLRSALPSAELHRLHLPPPEGPFEGGDLTYISSADGAAALARIAPAGERRAAVIQVETGDGREGVPTAALEELARLVAAHPRLTLAGVSTNYACFLGDAGGVHRSLRVLAAAVRRLRRRGIAVERVSAGNSSTLPLVLAGEPLPSEITELRCGEALLLGRDALRGRPLPGCRQDVVQIRAEVLERYTKRRSSPDAVRVVLDVGWQDLGAGTLRFALPDMREAGRSSDYLVAETRSQGPQVGETVEMTPSYPVMVAAWTSPFVQVRCV